MADKPKDWQAQMVEHTASMNDQLVAIKDVFETKLTALEGTFAAWREEEQRTHEKLDEELIGLTRSINGFNALIRRGLIAAVSVLLMTNGYLLVKYVLP